MGKASMSNTNEAAAIFKHRPERVRQSEVVAIFKHLPESVRLKALARPLASGTPCRWGINGA